MPEARKVERGRNLERMHGIIQETLIEQSRKICREECLKDLGDNLESKPAIT